MVNFSVLGNMTTLTLNNSLINNSDELIVTSINNANSITGNYLGLGILIVIFLFFIVYTYRDDMGIRLDITRSLVFSSGITSCIGILLLVLGYINSFQHVVWFVVIFFLSFMSIYFIKQKGG
jgi:hypothetical protein